MPPHLVPSACAAELHAVSDVMYVYLRHVDRATCASVGVGVVKLGKGFLQRHASAARAASIHCYACAQEEYGPHPLGQAPDPMLLHAMPEDNPHVPDGAADAWHKSRAQSSTMRLCQRADR